MQANEQTELISWVNLICTPFSLADLCQIFLKQTSIMSCPQWSVAQYRWCTGNCQPRWWRLYSPRISTRHRDLLKHALDYTNSLSAICAVCYGIRRSWSAVSLLSGLQHHVILGSEYFNTLWHEFWWRIVLCRNKWRMLHPAPIILHVRANNTVRCVVNIVCNHDG